MFGIIWGGLIGGPIGTFLIDRHKLRKPKVHPGEGPAPSADEIVEAKVPESRESAPAGEDQEAYVLLKNLVVLLVAMWIGSWLSKGFQSLTSLCPSTSGPCSSRP